MKKTIIFFVVLMAFSEIHAQMVQQGFEGPITSPWSGNGAIVGSQGGSWNTHNGGGMYELTYTESIYVSLNLEAVTKFIGLWINEELPANNSISIDLQSSTGTFIQNIGTHNASSSGFWLYHEYQLGAGYTGDSRISFGRSYSGGAAANSTYLDDITIMTNVGVEELSSNDFKLYPNPAKNALNLVFRVNLENVKIEIVDLTGKTVYFNNESLNLAANETLEMNISALNAGIYMCKIQCGVNEVIQKIVVE